MVSFGRTARRCKYFKYLVLLLLVIFIPLLLFLWSEELLLPNVTDVNRYSSVIIAPGFEIKPPFSFPQPDGIYSVEKISRRKWIQRLADILSKKSHKTVYLLACDSNAYPSLLNWLVSAYVNTEIDIEDILVLSLDERIYRKLNERDISTVYIKMEDFIRHHYLLSMRKEQFQFYAIARMSVARLISHWGYDVAVFNVDAIPLKDPLSLYKVFSDSDIVSSHSLREDPESGKWSLSFGFAYFRSSRTIEYLWEYASNITEKRWCDQEKLNRVISVHLGAQWSLDSRRTQKCKMHMSHLCDVTGVTRTGLKVTLLSRWAVCRYCGLSRMEDYYIWYKQGKSRSQDDRQKAAEFGSVWFLRDNWKKIDKKTTHTRENWLHDITDSI